MVNMSEAVFEECYEAIKDKLDNKLTVGNLVAFIVLTMEVVEKYKGLNGLQKKQMVLYVCDRVVVDSDHPEELKEGIQTVIATVGPNVIDALIFASKGKLILNAKKKFKKRISDMFKKCLS